MICSCLPASQPVCLPACLFRSFWLAYNNNNSNNDSYNWCTVLNPTAAVWIFNSFILIENFTSTEVELARSWPHSHSRFENKWSVLCKPITTSFPNKQQITADDAMRCDALMIIYCGAINLWRIILCAHRFRSTKRFSKMIEKLFPYTVSNFNTRHRVLNKLKLWELKLSISNRMCFLFVFIWVCAANWQISASFTFTQ